MNTTDNLYQLDGRVNLAKAVPFGLQHVLAMFVSNVTPIIILLGIIGADKGLTASLVQNAMIIAGIGTLVQLYEHLSVSRSGTAGVLAPPYTIHHQCDA